MALCAWLWAPHLLLTVGDREPKSGWRPRVPPSVTGVWRESSAPQLAAAPNGASALGAIPRQGCECLGSGPRSWNLEDRPGKMAWRRAGCGLSHASAGRDSSRGRCPSGAMDFRGEVDLLGGPSGWTPDVPRCSTGRESAQVDSGLLSPLP